MNIYWIILVLFYLGISIYFGLKPNSGKLLDQLNTSIKSKSGTITLLSSLRYISTLILLIIGFFFFLPAGLIGILRNKISNWKIEKEIKYKERTGYLYHESLGGCGTLYCKVCDNQEDIVSFLHWIGEKHGSKTGYQCQKCGKHLTIYRDNETKPILTCDCGGELNREKPLFCTKCKSKELRYEIDIIT